MTEGVTGGWAGLAGFGGPAALQTRGRAAQPVRELWERQRLALEALSSSQRLWGRRLCRDEPCPAPRLPRLLGSAVIWDSQPPLERVYPAVSSTDPTARSKGVRFAQKAVPGWHQAGGPVTVTCHWGGGTGANPQAHPFPVHPLLCLRFPSSSPAWLQPMRVPRAHSLIPDRTSCLRGLGPASLGSPHRCIHTRAGFGQVLPPHPCIPAGSAAGQHVLLSSHVPSCVQEQVSPHPTPCVLHQRVPPPRWKHSGKTRTGKREVLG